MPRVQYNKLWGLKKLRLVCKRLPGVARFAPFKVYHFPEQHQTTHDQNRPRLLVRTDEKGKSYRQLEYNIVPRFDVKTDEWTPAYVRNQVSQRTKEPSRFFQQRGRFIVHPTGTRESVACTGNIYLIPATKRSGAVIRIDWGHGSKSGDITFDQTVSTRLLPSDIEHLPAHAPAGVSRALAANLAAFLRMAIQTRQLNLSREHEFRFNSWKDDPDVPEFYDWKEYREQKPQAKKPKKKK